MRKNELHDFIWNNYTRNTTVLQLVVNVLDSAEKQELAEREATDYVHSLLKGIGIEEGEIAAFVFPKATPEDVEVSFSPDYDGPDICFVRYDGSGFLIHKNGYDLDYCKSLTDSGTLFFYDCTEQELEAWRRGKNIKAFNAVTDDSRLNVLLKNFNSKLEDAKHARSEIMDYLEEEYGIDTDAENGLEEECDWCYGVDTFKIERAIKRVKEDDRER